MEDWIPYAVSISAALTVTTLMVPLAMRLAHRVGAVDRPGGRRVHDGDVPRLGGIAIFLGFVAGVSLATLVAGRAESFSDLTDYHWMGVAFGIAFMFLAGTLDDVLHLNPLTKLALQILAAMISVMSGFRIETLTSPLGGSVSLGALAPWVTIGWILLVVNAMNLIDGLDGLAGGLALIMTTTVAFIALTMNHFGVVISALGLAGAVIGFLRFNFVPARVFMGDGGSQFLGYVLAVISIRGAQKGATAIAIFSPLLIMGLPVSDVLTTIYRRAARPSISEDSRGILHLARRVARADREHLHHNLLALGISPRRAVLLLYLLASLFALAAWLVVTQRSVALAVLTLAVSLGAILLIKLAYRARAASRPDSIGRESPL